MDFTSDNAAGVHPMLLEAMLAAAGPQALGYDSDPWSDRLDAAFSELFGTATRAFAVPSGTAANALGLAACAPPWGGIWCHAEAHIEIDEAGAVPFYSGGASLMLVPAPFGKLTPEALDTAAARHRGDVHQVQPAALSLTQATEWGTVYSPEEISALGNWAKARNLRMQMDGARFANAVAHLGCHPSETSWLAGVDALSFGCIKNGGMSAEALLIFNPELAESIPFRRKRAGLMPSKGRFAAAQLLAMLENGLWLENARASNDAAQRLAQAVEKRLLAPVQANQLFVRLESEHRARLRAKGYSFYDWELGGPDAVRLVVRWDQPAEIVDALARELALP